LSWGNYYHPPSSWEGRQDNHTRERLFQFVNTINLQHKPLPENSSVILGFACDEGVKRNKGRPGAKEGPSALRKALSNITLQMQQSIYDVGDIICENDLEAAQNALGLLIAELLLKKNQLIVLGGGHEIAWGHFQGISQAFPSLDMGIINFDAHFDLRELPDSKKGSSGTPFTQIAQTQPDSFSYACIGIQPCANTKTLFNKANSLQVKTLLASDVNKKAQQVVDQMLKKHDAIYLTLCLDVFAQAFAPGVSAPQALGLTPQQVLPLLQQIAKHNGVVFFDVAELSPPYDQDGMTAKLAASCIAEFLTIRESIYTYRE
jgi:formiminoglutamase